MEAATLKKATEIEEAIAQTDGLLALCFVGSFSAKTPEAVKAFEEFARENPEVRSIVVDVAEVKGLHKRFGVSEVPTVVLLKEGKVQRKVVGLQTAGYYERALLGSSAPTPGKDSGRAARSVTVYTGANCPWCRRLVSYLRRRRVRFTEIDVSKDPGAAQALVARTGHTGVPQTRIGDTFVVGFNKPRIDELLGLAPEDE